MRHSSRVLPYLFCSLILLTSCFFSVASGDDDPSVAVVAISSYDQSMEHAGVVGEMVGFPNVEQMVELQLMQLTGGKPLAGLDKTRPIVVDVKLGKKEPYFIACLPVTSLKELLGSLSPEVAETEDVGDGLLLLKGAESPMYAREANGWAYFADQKDHLTSVSKDPASLAGNLTSKYVVAARADVQNIPTDKRAEVIGFLELMMQLQLAGAAEVGSDAEAQQEIMKANIAQLSQLIDESDNFTVGIGIDHQQKNVHLDFSATALAGTQTATAYKRFQKGKSSHAGFLHTDAAVAAAMHLTGKPGANELKMLDLQQKAFQEQMTRGLNDDEDLSDDKKETIKDAGGKLLNVFYDTMRSSSLQLGMAMMLNKKSTVVWGMKVSDGNAIEAALKQLIELATAEMQMPGPDWEAENHGFYRIHTWKNIPLPDDDEAVISLAIGEQMEAAIAVNAESIYVSAGGNAIEELKKVIDASAKASKETTEPAEAVINLGQIMQFAAEVNKENGPMYLPLVGMLQEKDAIKYGIEQIPNGVRVRITVEQNILRALPLMSMMAGMNQQ